MASRLKRNVALLGAAVVLVAGFEGLRTVAYRDPIGIPTICFGETRDVHMGDVKTKAECRDMLGDRLVEFERDMRACLTKPDSIPDGPYIASLSLTYNIGAKAFCRSRVAMYLNSQMYRSACDAMLAFNKAGGMVLPGLVNRRRAERDVCLKGLG